MPRVVIEEFVKDLDDDEKEHSDNDNEEKAEKPHKLLTHHEIDDVSTLFISIKFMCSSPKLIQIMLHSALQEAQNNRRAQERDGASTMFFHLVGNGE